MAPTQRDCFACARNDELFEIEHKRAPVKLPHNVILILVALSLLVLARAPSVFAQQATDDTSPEPAAPPATEPAPAAAGPKDVFVPTEKIGAGAVVAFPVDI